jgi:hypothetical protein
MEDQIFSTQELQKFSLMQAMERIGYQMMRTQTNQILFVNHNNFRKGKGIISVRNAIKYYNNPRLIKEFLDMDSYTYYQYMAARITCGVKLQYSNKRKVFVPLKETENYVKFVDKDYASIFLPLEGVESQE